jgi:gamma-glutamylcyclotransferase (GGCT)/AIG2-like uncharacterized protein YtfP
MNLLFVYGTLRRGEVRHRMLEAGRVLTIIPASVAGQLLDFGDYPGLVRGGNGSRVHGELIEFENFDDIAASIDDEEGPDFARGFVHCTTPDGGRYKAWVYRFTGAAKDARIISSGDWRVRGY